MVPMSKLGPLSAVANDHFQRVAAIEAGGAPLNAGTSRGIEEPAVDVCAQTKQKTPATPLVGQHRGLSVNPACLGGGASRNGLPAAIVAFAVASACGGKLGFGNACT